MIIYLVLACILIIQVFTYWKPIASNEANKTFVKINSTKISSKMLWCIVDMLIMFFIALLRDISVGTDYKNYYSIICEIRNLKIEDIVHYTQQRYIEVGFTFFVKILLMICKNPLFVIAVFYIIILLGVVCFSYCFNLNYILSLYLFLTFSMYNQSLNVMRQYLAAAIILFSLCAIKKKRTLIAFFLIAIAFSIHSSAIIGVIFFIVYKVNIDLTKICLGMTISALILSFLGMKFVSYIVQFTSYSNYLHKELYQESGIGLIMNFLFFFLFVFTAKNSQNKNNYNLWLFACALTLSLNFFISELGMVGRMMIYTKMLYPFSLQELINSIKNNKSKAMIGYIMIVLFFIYYVISIMGSSFNTVPYKFM